ncbi:glycerol transporter [Myotisia sp. PD_48]|nr:glycerol transporter [Myotisia sp. PD_48]
MGVIYWLQRLYSVDTLDTRFTVSSSTPPKRSIRSDQATFPQDGHERAKNNANQGTAIPGAHPARWRTGEFYIYYVVFAVAVPMMFKAVIDISKDSHPAYPSYSEELSRGWILGRKVDNTDAQYSSFRDNIPYMTLLVILHPILRRVYDHFLPVTPANNDRPASNGKVRDDDTPQGMIENADARMSQRINFDFRFGLVLIAALHGFSIFKILAILWLNYMIATRLPRAQIPPATWIFNIGILFANELLDGYHYADIATTLFSADPKSFVGIWASWLDSYGGIISRWEVLFKITILRLISFNMDYYWSLDYRSGSPVEKKQIDPSALSERDRVATPAPSSSFNAKNYVAYILYSPLYLAGPILTFNDYINQQQYRPISLTRTRTILYGVRFLLTLLCMELILHYIYVVAISKSSPDWSTYTPFQLSMLGFFNLHIIWLKLLIPWRFFRLWALIDGIDPPENMVRCMSNNYSALAFWRGWHRSFNRWVVRYMYIPLGGSGRTSSTNPDGQSVLKTKLRSTGNFLAVFTFVALWHDINLQLLMWGWLITFFVLPEIIATVLFPAHKWRSRPNTYRVLCGIGAVGNVLAMMAANLVGFAVGLDGLKGLVHGIVGSYAGFAYLIAACATLFVGVQVMFEIREEELRGGIRLKC